MLDLAGDPPVSVRSIKVSAGRPQAMSTADALAGLKQALPYLQQAARQSEVEGKTPNGSFVATFVTEPDGMIRVMMEREVQLTRGDPEGVVKALGGSALSQKWRFPANRSPRNLSRHTTCADGTRRDRADWVAKR